MSRPTLDPGAPVDAAVTVIGVAPPTATPFQTLLPSALSGAARDEAARALWDLHYAPLAGWAASLVGDRDTAHDIASEAFTRMVARWGRVKDPKGFLYVTATNLARDVWRREQRDRRLNARLQLVTPMTAPASDGSLRDLVDKLDERMRTPVLLHYYADLPIAEVARALHKPEGTIKRTLSDARRVLHAWLEKDE
jgi:RNA polymerase sigma-70 factor (ECF subfamily)